MAKFESENRRVAWFENSVHPALRKAGDEPPDPEIGGDEPPDPEIGGFVDPPKHFVPDPITYTGSDEDYHGPGSAWFSQTYGNPRLLDHEGANVQMYDEPDTLGGASVVKWGGPHWPFRHTTPTDGVKTYENGRQVGVVSVSRNSGPLREPQVINPPGDLKREASITAGLGALGLAPQVLGYYPDAAKAPARHKLERTDDYGEPMYGNYLGNQALHTTHAGNDGFRPVAKWHNWDRSDPEQHVNDLISLWQSGLTSMQRMHQAGYGHGNLFEFKDDHIWHNPESNEVRFTDFGGLDSFGPNDPLYHKGSWGNFPEIVENGKKMVRLRDMSGLTNTIFGLMTFGRQPERMKQFEDQARHEQGISASNIVTQSAKKQARQKFLENPEEFYETMLKPQGYGTKDPEKFKKFLEALRSSMLDPTVLQSPFSLDKGNIDYDTYVKHVRNSVSELSQARKSMKKSWFENSVHPALRKAKEEKHGQV